MSGWVSRVRLWNWIVTLLLMAAMAAGVSAQTPTGGITGTVTDASGAVIPGATVTITEITTGRVVTATTTSAGLYDVRGLLPSTYQVKITKKGFSTEVLNNVEVNAGQNVSGSASLKIGEAVSQVEVSSAADAVNTVSQTVSDVVTTSTINQLPQNQRNFLDMAALLPGVNVRNGGAIDPTKSNAYRAVGVDGRSGTATRVQLDGIDITDETVGTTAANPSQESISEFQLTRSSLDLSTSLTSSGAVSILSKTGTNNLHGDGFYQYRNQSMGARQGFECSFGKADCPDGYAKAFPFYRHQMGGSIGGPFIRDKWFFYTTYEHTAEATQSVVQPGSPRAALYPQFSGKSAQLTNPINIGSVRIDGNLTPAQRIFWRFNYDDNLSTGGDVLSPYQNVDWTNLNIWGWDWGHNNFTSSVRAGYLKFHNRIISSELTVPFYRVNGVPVQINTLQGLLSWGPNGLAPQRTDQVNKQFKWDATWLKGKHNLRFGFEENRINLGGYANFAGPLALTDDGTGSVVKNGDKSNLNDYLLGSFSMGPNSGYFTVAPGLGLPHGAHQNWRTAFYVGDSYHATSNLTVNIGTRWEYDSGFFNQEKGINRPAYLDYYQPGASQHPKMPKHEFGPQLGFAWDVSGNGKTVIRGGGYIAYEMDIYNNLLFDQYQLIPPGIGPDLYDQTQVLALGSDGKLDPVVVPAADAFNTPSMSAGQRCDSSQGVYNCLVGQPIGTVAPVVAQIYTTMNQMYTTNGSHYSASGVPNITQTNGGPLYGAIVPGSNFKVPYSVQLNIGVQHQFGNGVVLSADYVRLHGVGIPFMIQEMEHRRGADTLNPAAAQTAIANAIANFTYTDSSGATASCSGTASPIDCIAQNGGNIGTFGLANDKVFQGLTPNPKAPAPLNTTNFARVRFLENGFTSYNGLQLHLTGRSTGSHLYGFDHGLNYSISYALSRSEASAGCDRAEFLCGALDERHINSKATFGPTSLDYTHTASARVAFTTWGGMDLNWTVSLRSPGSATMYVPALSHVGTSSSNRIFSTDINGDGNSGGSSPVLDVLPGVGVGGMDRTIGSWQDLNKAIDAFNATYANKLTPAGQALVDAGLFTTQQMKELGAYVSPVPHVNTSNPWPYSWYYNADVRIERPFHVGGDRITVNPFLDVFNVFNHTGFGAYGSAGSKGPWTSDPTLGSWIVDYSDPAVQSALGQGGLNGLRGRQTRNDGTDNRLIQFGFRVTF